jgi:isopenicillin-N epimerase
MTPNQFAPLWTLAPEITFLNHGSFGACPRAVLDEQTRLRGLMEREPVRFLWRELEERLDQARQRIGRFVNATPDNIAFLVNATTGINAVLRSLRFPKGADLLTTSHVYNACGNALRYVAERDDLQVVIADIPYPVKDLEDVVGAILSRCTEKTHLALIDHVTSATGLVLPIERIVSELKDRGVDTLVDGAHAPGMVEVDIERIQPAFYAANCHKWMCAPKGAAFLYVAPKYRDEIRPLTISHGANSTREDRSRFLLEFDWTGTRDTTPFLTVPFALDYLESLLPGGWDELRTRNRALALQAREILFEALGLEPPCPESMIGTLVNVPLRPLADRVKTSLIDSTKLHDILYADYNIEAMTQAFPEPDDLAIRVSAMLYNTEEQYQELADALIASLKITRGGQ